MIARLARTARSPASVSAHSTSPAPPLRCAVIGGGFAGVAAAWHLLRASSAAGRLVQLDLYDAFGLAAGGSGAAAGLLHPYSARGKVLWQGLEAFQDAVHLVKAAEAAAGPDAEQIAWRHGLLRPARSGKQAADLHRFVGRDAAAAQALQAECINVPTMAALLPGFQPPEGLLGPGPVEATPAAALPGAAGLLVRRGLVLHPKRYLAALWAACEQLAAAAGDGSSAQLLCQPVTSLRELHSGRGPYDAVVVAAGAAVDGIEETAGQLPLQLCHGLTLDMQPGSAHSSGTAFPAGAPSLLGPTYLAAQGREHLVIGATKRYGVTPTEAYALCGNNAEPLGSAAAADASAALLPSVAALWPPLEQWQIAEVRSGVRALPSRTQLGSMPYAGRLPGGPGAGWWLIGGLGARGLVYHAWLGKLVAAAVLARDEEGLPPELRRWQAGGGGGKA